MRHYVLLLFVSLVSVLHGQHVVMLPTGFAPVDVSVIEAANQTLQIASASSGFDIKMAFLTSLPGADGRYEEYKRLDPNYLEFLRTPASSAYSTDAPDATAEHSRLLRKGVELLNVAENRSLTIIYTTVITLSATGVLHDQKKTVYYGTGFSDCDKRRFEQIEDFTGKPTDFCVKSAAAENNAYVAWYSARLAEATGDDYVITGSISFNGNIYCEPTELYINDQHNSVLTSTFDFHPPIRLMVHPESVVPTVSWSCPTSSATLFTSATGAFNTLNFQPAAFEQFNELIADWGDGRRSSISVLPVNFQVKVDEELLEQQGNEIEEITYEYKNNHTNFPVRDNIIINLIGPTNVAGAPREETILPTESGASFSWTPNEEECDPYNFEHILLANSRGLSEESSITSFKLKCAFEMVNLQLSIPHTLTSKVTNGSPNGNLRSVFENETLYIVSTDVATVLSAGQTTTEDFQRSATAKITWQGNEIPELDDFWEQEPIVTGAKEPIWRATINGDFPALGLEDTEQLSEIEIEFTEGSFPPTPTATTVGLPTTNANQANAVFNHFFPKSDEKPGLLKVRAFERELEVPLRFLHKNLREVDDPNEEIPPQLAINIKDIMDNPLMFFRGEVVDALPWTDDWLPNNFNYNPLPGNVDLYSEVYSEERRDDPNYNSYISSKLQCSYDFFEFPRNGQYLALGANSQVGSAGWAGIKFVFSAGGIVAFNRKRINNATVTGLLDDYPSTIDVDSGTLDGKVEIIAGPNAGGEVDQGGTGVSVAGEVGIRIDLEAKSTWTLEWTSDRSVDLVIMPRVYPLKTYFSANITIEIGDWTFTPFGEDGYTDEDIVDDIIDGAIDWLPDGLADLLPTLPQTVTHFPPIRFPISW